MISAFTELCPYSLFSTDTHARYHYYISRDKLRLSYAKPMLNCARMDKPNWSRQTYVGMAEKKTLSGGGQIILPGQIDLLRQKSLVRQDSLKWDNIYIIIVDLSSATTFIYFGPYLQISATIFILLIQDMSAWLARPENRLHLSARVGHRGKHWLQAFSFNQIL
jgi:hypothetical protein